MADSLAHERDNQIREAQLEDRLEWEKFGKFDPRDNSSRGERSSCPSCGNFFAETRRIWPSVGVGWGGELSDFYREGLCPKCYRELKNYEYAWSIDEWKAYLLVKTATVKEFAQGYFEVYISGPEDEQWLYQMSGMVSEAELLVSQAAEYCPDCADSVEECLTYVSQLPIEAKRIIKARRKNDAIMITVIVMLVIGAGALILLAQ